MRFSTRTGRLLVLGALVLGVHAQGAAQAAGNQAADAFKSPEQVGQLLVDQKKVVTLALPKGKVKHSIEKGAPMFSLVNGESPAVLFRLPEYRGPYELVITSLCNCIGFSKSIFVPSGFFLDEATRQTHELSEVAFKTHSSGVKAYHVDAAIVIDDERKGDRFILLYTLGDTVGERQGRVNALSSGAAVATIPISIKRSLNGTLELETRVKP